MANQTQKQRADVAPIAPEELVDRPKLGTTIEPVPQPHPFWRIVGVVGAAFLLMWVMQYASYGGLNMFTDYPSGAIVVGCTVGLLLGVFGWMGCRAALRTLFARPSSVAQSDDAISFFRLGAGFALATGFMGASIGFIKMLASMDDPSHIGAGMALCLLSQFYGVILAVLLWTASAIVAKRDCDSERLKKMATGSVMVASGVSAVGLIATFFAFAIVLATVVEFSIPT